MTQASEERTKDRGQEGRKALTLGHCSCPQPLHRCPECSGSWRDRTKKNWVLLCHALFPLFSSCDTLFEIFLPFGEKAPVVVLEHSALWSVLFVLNLQIPGVVPTSRTEVRGCSRQHPRCSGLRTGWQLFEETWLLTHPGHQKNQCRDNIRAERWRERTDVGTELKPCSRAGQDRQRSCVCAKKLLGAWSSYFSLPGCWVHLLDCWAIPSPRRRSG